MAPDLRRWRGWWSGNDSGHDSSPRPQDTDPDEAMGRESMESAAPDLVGAPEAPAPAPELRAASDAEPARAPGEAADAGVSAAWLAAKPPVLGGRGPVLPGDLHARAVVVAGLPKGRPIPSPCIDVCQIDPASGLCRGCRRTLDEIATWGSLPELGKRAVWAALPMRPQPG